MNDYTIDVAQIEEWQMVKNMAALQTVFSRAKSAVVNGAAVVLVRREPDGRTNKFDEIDTLEALEAYKLQVFKYLNT